MTLLKNRVAAMTTDGDHHNRWPDACEIVGIYRMVEDNKSESWELKRDHKVSPYDLGILHGQADHERFISDLGGEVPPEVLEGLGITGFKYSTTVRFCWAPKMGQIDYYDHRNILVIFPKQGYVELGCAHRYDVVQAGRCYRKCVCTRCGHKYEVDSSD